MSGVPRIRAARGAVRASGPARRGRGGGSRSGRSFAVTLLTPVLAGQGEDLRAQLDALDVGDRSPLARLPYVHFARWVMIDQLKTDWAGAPDPPPRLRSEYLLFTASVTAPAEDLVTPSGARYVDRLPESFLYELCTRIPADVHQIWRYCVGYPGISDADAVVRYLGRSQLETSLFHVGYADVTVDEVRQALAARDALVAFARDHQDEQDPQRLQQAYLEESPTWFPSR